ncbi:Heavy metal-associated isoprenylated plant protein 20 [Linum grandiflorum]
MHCNACERVVAKTISKFDGVQQFTTQKHKHKVVVTGHIDPLKLLKKLKKKTKKSKFVEIVEAAPNDAGEPPATAAGDDEQQRMVDGSSSGSEMVMNPYQYYCYYGYYNNGWPPWRRECNHDAFMAAFSDENPNACSLM